MGISVEIVYFRPRAPRRGLSIKIDIDLQSVHDRPKETAVQRTRMRLVQGSRDDAQRETVPAVLRKRAAHSPVNDPPAWVYFFGLSLY